MQSRLEVLTNKCEEGHEQGLVFCRKLTTAECVDATTAGQLSCSNCAVDESYIFYDLIDKLIGVCDV